MGYSYSIKTVQRNMTMLQPLVHKTSHVYPNEKFPHKLAYKIRESIRIASKNPETFPELAALAGKIRVRVVGTSVVVDRPEDFTNDVPLPFTHQGLELPLKLYNVTQASIVVGHWLDHLPSTQPIVMEHCQLPINELQTLARWAAKQTPALMVLWAPAQNIATLALDDASVPPEARIQP